MSAPLVAVDCEEFHSLAMDYRGAPITAEGNWPQVAYEKLVACVDQHTARAVAAARAAAIEEAAELAEQTNSHGEFIAGTIRAISQSAAPPVAGELPPLPKYYGMIDVYHDDARVTSVEGWTADQMRGYAIDYAMQLGRTAISAQPVQQPAAVVGHCVILTGKCQCEPGQQQGCISWRARPTAPVPAPAAAVVGQEPVYFTQGPEGGGTWGESDQRGYERAIENGNRGRILYTAPVPAPAAVVVGQEPAPRTAMDRVLEWEGFQRISDIPAVHEALQDFSDDPTGDNGVYVVREVLKAAATVPAAGVQGDDDLQTALTVFDMGLGFALCHKDFGDTRGAIKELQKNFAVIRDKINQQATVQPDSGRDAALVKEQVEQYRKGYRHGYEEGKAEIATHPAPSSDTKGGAK